MIVSEAKIKVWDIFYLLLKASLLRKITSSVSRGNLKVNKDCIFRSLDFRKKFVGHKRHKAYDVKLETNKYIFF